MKNTAPPRALRGRGFTGAAPPRTAEKLKTRCIGYHATRFIVRTIKGFIRTYMILSIVVRLSKLYSMTD